jgi:hypothetical protein
MDKASTSASFKVAGPGPLAGCWLDAVEGVAPVITSGSHFAALLATADCNSASVALTDVTVSESVANEASSCLGNDIAMQEVKVVPDTEARTKPRNCFCLLFTPWRSVSRSAETKRAKVEKVSSSGEDVSNSLSSTSADLEDLQAVRVPKSSSSLYIIFVSFILFLCFWLGLTTLFL